VHVAAANFASGMSPSQKRRFTSAYTKKSPVSQYSYIAKSTIEVTTCTSSNILVWVGRDATEKGVAGLTESLISSPFAILPKLRDVVVKIVELPLYILSSLVHRGFGVYGTR
jgi:hypothetical protein